MVQSTIETGVDRLVDLVLKEGKISISDAAQRLTVSTSNIEEWADFLEEEGIISIEHGISGMFLTPKKLSKQDVTRRSREFKGEREVFQRRVSNAMTDMEREAQELRLLRTEFKNIEGEMGGDLKVVQNELGAIDKFREYEQKIIEKKSDFEQDYDEKIEGLSRRVNLLQKRLDSLMTLRLEKEEDISSKEKDMDLVAQKEKLLRISLKSIVSKVEGLEKQLDKDEKSITIDRNELKKVAEIQGQYESDIESSKRELSKMLNKIQDHQEDIKKREDQLLEKLSKSEVMTKTKTVDVNKVKSKFKGFFEKYNKIKKTMNTLDNDYSGMKLHFKTLKKKAKAYDVAVREGSAQEHINAMEHQFDNFDSKRSNFKKELQKLRDVLKIRA